MKGQFQFPTDFEAVASWLRAASVAIGAILVLSGSIVLFGWAFGVPSARTLFLGPVAVAPNGGLAHLLMGGSLLLLNQRNPALRRIGVALALLVGVMAAVTWGEYLFGRSFGIDGVLFHPHLEPYGSPWPGRMPISVSIGYVMVSAALLARCYGLRQTANGIASFAFLFLFTGALVMVVLQPNPPLTPLSLPAYVLDSLLCIGVLFSEADAALASRLIGPRPSSIVLRRLMVIMLLVVPAGLVWIETAYRTGIFPGVYGSITISLIGLAAAVALISLDLRWLEALETQRLAAVQDAANKAAELRKAEELNRLKDQFLSTISHEMRTPLALIKGYAELLEDMGGEAELVAGIQEGSRRLEEHLDRILGFSALASGAIALHETDVIPAEIVRTVALAERERLDTKHLALDVEVDPTVSAVPADQKYLFRVLHELLDNAANVTPEGGRVALHVRKADRGVRFEVEDHGPGIPPTAIGTLTEPFSQVEATDADRRGGLGLGLAIARKIVELHGGRLDIVSRAGVGSIFSVFLPSESAAPAMPPDASIKP